MSKRKVEYNPNKASAKEIELKRLFNLQMEDAKLYFLAVIKPRLDKSYKLYMSYAGDRAKQIKKWQNNIFVPYIHSVVETMIPRILDARPDFTAQARREEDQFKTEKQQKLMDYLWERAKMDKTAEDLVRQSCITGTSYLHVFWKKEIKKGKFLKTQDIASKKYTYKEKELVTYDAPYCEVVDNYSLWYDWHNTERESKNYWFKRRILTKEEIIKSYPMADKKRIEEACASGSGNLTDYAEVRNLVREIGENAYKENIKTFSGTEQDKYSNAESAEIQMFEVFEWTRPYDDSYCVIVGSGQVPILRGLEIPIPYDFKESTFIEVPFLKLPFEFEGVGIPLILENPQLVLNLLKNQRLDNVILSIHKMWIVNPLANINKEELVTRPFGIIYSIDPNGVREVQFGDIKASAYKEEELLKQDMRYASGVDDFSMGAGGGAGSATEVRHLRESTLERVRLFVNHLGDAFSDLMRYWMDMTRQFYTKPMVIRVIGEDGAITFPTVEKDDLCGYFDYKAKVLPAIAGQLEVKKKQDMDLFQLLINLPFIDPKKLTKKVLSSWEWSLDNLLSEEMPGMPGMQGSGVEGAEGELPPEMLGGAPEELPIGANPIQPQQPIATKSISPDILRSALSILNKGASLPNQSPMAELSNPINLLKNKSAPPTAQKLSPAGKTTNPRGLNKGRGKKVDTNLKTKSKNTEESRLMNRVNNIQR